MKISLDQLKMVYLRGQWASFSNFLPGKTCGQWAIARVNFFLKLVRNDNIKISYSKRDLDILQRELKYYVEEEWACFSDFEELDFVLARLDLLKFHVSDQESDKELHIDLPVEERKTLYKPFIFPTENGEKRYGVYVKNPFKNGEVEAVVFSEPCDKISYSESYHDCELRNAIRPAYWSNKFWKRIPLEKMVTSEVIEWDENGQLSKWGWDDLGFADLGDLIRINPSLIDVTIF